MNNPSLLLVCAAAIGLSGCAPDRTPSAQEQATKLVEQTLGSKAEIRLLSERTVDGRSVVCGRVGEIPTEGQKLPLADRPFIVVDGSLSIATGPDDLNFHKRAEQLCGTDLGRLVEPIP